ncbi:luciferase-like protein [Mycobacterium mantenii]|uniref:Luciferase-like protein n=2 Tax=Mycobacterium mantenii TaxID=560555 RepID=A0ABN6AAL1_MYCNT|nr:TIGR03857 family LLM class F420-dependent oxidoreductase [Mycobacterium mantenii]BBY40107.1 luciferase-like protein [Mycobacterium mantenii]
MTGDDRLRGVSPQPAARDTPLNMRYSRTKRVTPELGAYVLPGRITDVRPGLQQAAIGERIGLGSVWVSERWETKEIGATLGALTQNTSRVRLVAGVTHFGTRHPVVLAGMASTLQALSDNRLILGFGRNVAGMWRDLGIPTPVGAAIRDYADIYRALWRGETVTYDGPAGRYPRIRLTDTPAVAPPLILAAIGPNSLHLAGAHFDGAVLHPFLTTEGVARSVAMVRDAAKEAGRDPATVKIYAEVVVAPDCSDDQITKIVRARAATYFTLRDLARHIITANRWDPSPVHQLLADPRFANLELQAGTPEQLRARSLEAVSLVPDGWISTGAAIGSAAQVAARLHEYRAAGADEIVLHGTTTDRLGPLLKVYAKS